MDDKTEKKFYDIYVTCENCDWLGTISREKGVLWTNKSMIQICPNCECGGVLVKTIRSDFRFNLPCGGSNV